MTAYILTVDDDLQMLDILANTLLRQGYEVDQASSGEEALKRISARRPDLLVLDVGMPGMDGLTVCRRLREDPRYVTLPVLFLTAHSRPQDIVNGLDAGGDDYVVKPVDLSVFLARVRALLRRVQIREDRASSADQQESTLTIGDLTLDSNTYQATVGDRTVQLTATEHRLLRYLMEHPNQPQSPQHLLEMVWEYPPYAGDPDLVRVHIRNLRSKIEPDTRNPRFIHTVHGVGYMIRTSKE